MSLVLLRNLFPNGGFEVNVAGWQGYSVDRQGQNVNMNGLTPTRVAVSQPVHGEVGSWCAQVGNKTQGVVCINPLSQIPTVIGHQYYIKSQIRLRGSTTAGTASVCTVVDGKNTPAIGLTEPPTPLSVGLQTTNVTDWVLFDTIWTCDVTPFNPRWIWQTTANQGNNDIYGLADNKILVDLTNDLGAGNEPPLFAIRDAVDNIGGYWEDETELDLPMPPVITTTTIPVGLKNYSYSAIIELYDGTAPFIFNLSGLPIGHGLTTDSSGMISGVLNVDEGTYQLVVNVTDSVGYTVSKNYVFDVGEPPVIVSDFLPGAIVNQPYSFTPVVTGSQPIDIMITVTSGFLPAGLVIEGDLIHGTPTTDEQICQITVTAYNAYNSNGISKIYTLGVYSAPNISSVSPLPFATLNDSYTMTFIAGGVQPIIWEIIDGALPLGLSMTNQGVISGTPSQIGPYLFSVKATNDLGTDSRSFLLNVHELPIITTTSLGYARLGGTYSGQLMATGSPVPTFSITSGNLPTGLSLASNGMITGVALSTGIFTFTVVATNTAGNSLPVTLTIEAGLALAIVTTSPLPVGTLNAPYVGLQFHAEGLDSSQVPIESWSWTPQAGSQLPLGLTLNTTTGYLSGTPTQVGTYNVNVTVVNGPSSATSPFSISIGTVPVITSQVQLIGGVDRSFTSILSATGTPPITWKMTSLPNPSKVMVDSNEVDVDITLSNVGVLSWTKPIVGTYTFPVIAENIYGSSLVTNFTLTITTPSITDITIPDGVNGELYSHTFTGGGIPPFTWSYVSGTIPPGLSLNGSTGALSGTPIATGTYDFRIRVTNIHSHAEESFSITVRNKPIITTLSLNSVNVGFPYSQILQASGTTPLIWSVLPVSGSETGLPPGITLSGATLSGTPTLEGSYSFTIMVANDTGSIYADTRYLTLQVNLPYAPIITTNSIITTNKGANYSLTLQASNTDSQFYPVAWSLDSKSVLPNGISLSSSGVLSGIPLTPGTFEFKIFVENSDGTDSRVFTMIISDPPVIQTASLSNGIVGKPYKDKVKVTGDIPISWQVLTPNSSETGLPNGITLSESSGLLSGIPQLPGIFTFRIRATNNAGSHTVPLSITISSGITTFINGTIVNKLYLNGTIGNRVFGNATIIHEL